MPAAKEAFSPKGCSRALPQEKEGGAVQVKRLCGSALLETEGALKLVWMILDVSFFSWKWLGILGPDQGEDDRNLGCKTLRFSNCFASRSDFWLFSRFVLCASLTGQTALPSPPKSPPLNPF